MAGLAHSHAQLRFDRVDLDPPDRGPGIPKGPFEIGLVCAGSVSAGCYIGGVLDYLVEALDRWQVRKAADGGATPSVPNHAVVIRVLAGASGGAMSSALLAAARGRDFPHIRAANMPQNEAPTGNPLFDAWVQKIDIERLADTKDLSQGDSPIVSLLDSSSLRDIGLTTLQRLTESGPIRRPYFEDPFRVMLTVANLRGVPYWVPFQSADVAGHGMLQHGDHVRFAVSGSGGPVGPKPYGDETPLDNDPNPVGHWATLLDTALASGAFPVGLAARGLTADAANYDYRVTYPDPDQPKGQEPRQFIAIPPQAGDWPPPQSPIPFACVDGGTINNQPFDLAHRVLAGAHGSNPRGPNAASRAVLMIDPFPERPAYGPGDVSTLSVLGLLPPLKSLLVEQCRFREEDLLLAYDETVFSRFIIVPRRDGKGWLDKWHLASGSVGAFGGFLARAMRVHDYLLGRRNCQKFLLDHFALPEDHHLFDGWSKRPWAPSYWARGDDGAPYVDGAGRHYLPIIPVMRDDGGGVVGGDEKLPAWPQGCLPVSGLTDLIMVRVTALVDRLIGRLPWYVRAYLWPAKRSLLGGAKDQVSTFLSKLKSDYDF